MAAYAALVSLLNNQYLIRSQPYRFHCFQSFQIEYLGEITEYFLDFLDSYNNSYGGVVSKEEAEELESQIASAAHEAEDVIESYMVNQITPPSAENIPLLHRGCLFDLQKVILDMDFIRRRVLKLKEERGFNDRKLRNHTPAASSIPSAMVGFDDELMQLRDALTGPQSSRQIVSIVGMGGTGKTTLARNVYQDSLTVHHFDLLAWATISQEYDVREILLQLLSIPGKCTNETVDDLGLRLHQSLVGRRYLIVLDDMWCVELWDSIKFYFPDGSDGSRVVLTTRLSNVAAHLRSFCVGISFLDEHKSWDLFCQKVFGQEDCPPDLVDIGKKIVEQCKGLPLTIVVIGGLLRKSLRIAEYWTYVAENMSSILSSSENGQCLEVLNLSYSHLPANLKPCFLYMATFKEDYEIRVSELIKLWVAEAFLKPNGVQILEEMAEDYLKDLIDRNLVLVSAHRPNGKIKSCRIHDLLRELCVRVANKEKFFCVVRARGISQSTDCERRLVVHDKTSSNHRIEDFKGLQSTSLTRSLICDIPVPSAKSRLLRVLNKAFSPDWESAFQNLNLRYIDYQSDYLRDASMLRKSITLLWNLQTLVIRGSNQLTFPLLPIWWMPQLRHVKCSRVSIPDPLPSGEDDDCDVLENLQTLKRVSNFRLSEEACKRFSNIKKLCIRYSDMQEGYDRGLYANLQVFGSLQKLESMNIWCSERISGNELKKAFPSSLNKLSLGGCIVHWKDLSMISGSLPQLEVLKLNVLSCKECKWSCVDGGFLRLKFLSIVSCDLNSWTLDSAEYFPVLEKLILVYLSELEEIPSGFGQISTLQLIRLEYCNESAAISAMKIKEEQVTYGNEDLQIQVVKEGKPMTDVHSDKASKWWNVLVWVLRWWLSIKRRLARKSPCLDAHVSSCGDLFNSFNETDSMDWWDLSLSSSGQVFFGNEDLQIQVVKEGQPITEVHNDKASKRWNVLVWVLRWWLSIKRRVARKSPCLDAHVSSWDNLFNSFNESDSMDWWDLSSSSPVYRDEDLQIQFVKEGQPITEAHSDKASKRWNVLVWVLRWWLSIKRRVARKSPCLDAHVSYWGDCFNSFNETDSMDWWDLSLSSLGQVSHHSIHLIESMAPAFTTSEHLKYAEADCSPNLGTLFPRPAPVDIATKQWNVLFCLLRWRFSIKRIMARKNRARASSHGL